MKAAYGMVLLIVGISLEWVALHGYNAPDPGFRGLVEGIYGGIQAASAGAQQPQGG